MTKRIHPALSAAGFTDPKQVEVLVRRLLNEKRDKPWQDACRILERRFHCHVDQLEPSAEAWRLVKVIGELSEDIELQILARRALQDPTGDAHDPKS